MRMRFILIFLCLIMGCAADREKQKDYLLPPHNKLQLVKKEETIMATINSYSISGTINQDSLIDYPLERPEGKAIRKWHKASQREAEDLEMFLAETIIASSASLNMFMRSIEPHNTVARFGCSFRKSVRHKVAVTVSPWAAG